MYDCVDWVMRLSLQTHEVRMVSIYVHACACQGLRFWAQRFEGGVEK